jgi:hypothetical protein
MMRTTCHHETRMRCAGTTPPLHLEDAATAPGATVPVRAASADAAIIPTVVRRISVTVPVRHRGGPRS